MVQDTPKKSTPVTGGTSQERTLPEVFAELQAARRSYESGYRPVSEAFRKPESPSSVVPEWEQTFTPKSSFSFTKHRKKIISISSITVMIAAILMFVVMFSHSILAKDSSSPSVIPDTDVEFEVNRHRLNAHSIITANAAKEITKEQVTEERDIPYESVSQECTYLPKAERVVVQQGINGKKNVLVVKSYENGEFTEETILKEEKTLDYLPEIVNLGTSEFLARIKAHIGDTLYLSTAGTLRENPEDKANSLAEISRYLDVTLLELPSEDWCKVSYGSVVGYLPTKLLTSAAVTPTMPEKNRLQKILLTVNPDMVLNQPSGLTLKDYQKIFTGLPSDTNLVFQSNAQAFYQAEQNYHINGLFLASMAIHESAWGTSQIANDKKNLFGYGSYDSTPYESSYEFETYAEGIDLVAKVLTKYYINPPGTKIYGNELAVATYYHGSTLKDVNQRYASDPDWNTKVYSYMNYLYNRLSVK